jgi:hypothetical protein
VLDYNTEFKTANQVNTFYSDGPYRSSDHDPVIIGLNLNSPPSVSSGGPYTVAEGGSTTLTASGNDADAGTLTYDWDLDGNGTFETPGQAVQFSAASIDGPASRTVSVRVTDAGGLSATDTTTVAITNVAPTISSATAPPVNEGSPVVLTAAATDPAAADTLEFSFDCGSGFGPYGAAWSVSCPTNDSGPKTVRVRARDDDGGVSDTVSVTVPVANVAPTATFNAPASVNAGSPFTLSLSSPSDPSTADTAAGFTYAFDCGSGYGAFTSSPSAQCPTSAVGTRDVGGKIRDKDGGTSEYRGRVEVLVTATSLCALTRQYVTKNEGLANSLCVKAEHGSFGAYENEVSAQRGKALTGEQADILIALARALAG